MNTTRFNLDDFNPDGMFPSDLEEWQSFLIEQSHRCELYLRYTQNKLAAMKLREIGNIPEALQFEESCDAIYESIPSHLRSW